jgi:hypothetical protein
MRKAPLAAAVVLAASLVQPGVADAAPGVTLLSDTLLDQSALYFVSYDGLVNNNSFQKNGLLTYKGYQYAVWYTADKNAVVGRRVLGGSTWSTVQVGHTLKTSDSHNVISMGVSKVDGRLHLNMDSHSDGFTYVKSVAGLLDNPSGLSWTTARFGAPQSTLDGVALTSQFTYPQFVSTPDGKLQLSYRRGISGNGRNALAEYDGSAWTDLGEWSASTGTYTSEHGSSTARNTRARVEFLTTLALFSTRETVAVDTFARRATSSRFMVCPIVPGTHRGITRGSIAVSAYSRSRVTRLACRSCARF